MSDTMTDMEFMAAELVLGTLSHDERQQAQALQQHDRAFAGAVTLWEQQLLPLAAISPAIAPSRGLWPKIEQRLPIIPVRNMPRNKRWLAPVLMPLLLLVMALAGVSLYRTGENLVAPQTMVALLSDSQNTSKLEIRYTRTGDRLTLQPAMAAADGKSYEFWMIAPNAKPVSMGVVTGKAELHPQLNQMTDEQLASLTFAISVEPEGGSATGQPTGPVIMSGKMQRLSS